MISEDVLITTEDRTFVVDVIDAAARQAIQRLIFPSGDYVRVVPQEYIVELKEGRR